MTPEVEAHLAFLRGLEKRGDIKVNTGEAAKSGAKPLISNGNRTVWSPIRSVIIRMITKSYDRAAGVRFVSHEYDC